MHAQAASQLNLTHALGVRFCPIGLCEKLPSLQAEGWMHGSANWIQLHPHRAPDGTLAAASVFGTAFGQHSAARDPHGGTQDEGRQTRFATIFRTIRRD